MRLSLNFPVLEQGDEGAEREWEELTTGRRQDVSMVEHHGISFRFRSI
jgi:hypothetical protein